MAVSKAEGLAYGAGAAALLGAYLFRNRYDKQTVANAAIFGIGALLTGGMMSLYRRRSPQLRGAGLGLERGGTTTSKDGAKLTTWDDRTMGLRERVYLLQKLVAKSVQDPSMRELALKVVGPGGNVQVGKEVKRVRGARCQARDDECEAKAIFNWMTGNIRYTGDTGPHALKPGGEPEAVDEFQSAARTVEYKGGDCDDHAVLAATLAIKNGFAAKFRITSNTGETWDHIYTLVGLPKNDPTPRKWVALDTTLPRPKYGKEPAQAKHVDFAA